MKYVDRRWRLDSTGRVLGSGASSAIGLADEDGELVAYAGYDGRLGPMPPEDDDDEATLTDVERAEIADHMIALWERWKASGR